MNITEYRALQEALDFYKKNWSDVGLPTGGHIAPVLAAARRDLDRWQECGTCGGTGVLCGHTFAEALDIPEGDEDLCPTCDVCGGSGLLPNQTRMGAVFDAVHWVTWIEEKIDIKDAVTSRIGLAAVRAFDKEPT